MENDRGQFNGDGKECIHHWLIDERNSGVCKKCGESKQFSSSWGTVQRAWNMKAGKGHQDAPVTPITKK